MFKAFRYFLKTAAAELKMNYIWKCEKTTKENQHFHIVFECAPMEDYNAIKQIWVKACQRESIICHSYSSEFSKIKNTERDFIRIARYMSKQTDSKVDARLFGMSNGMQKYKSKVIKNDANRVEVLTDGLNIIAQTNFYTVFERNTEGV